MFSVLSYVQSKYNNNNNNNNNNNSKWSYSVYYFNNFLM